MRGACGVGAVRAQNAAGWSFDADDMTDSLKVRVLSGWPILALGAFLFIASFMPAILRGGDSAIAGMVAVVGLISLGAGVALSVAGTGKLTEGRARGLCLVLESVILAAGGAANGVLLHRGSFFAGLEAVRLTLLVVLVGLFVVATVARLAIAGEGSAAFCSHSPSIFSTGGRIDVVTFLGTQAVLTAASAVACVFIVAQGRHGAEGPALAFTLLLAVVPFFLRAQIGSYVKRLHDRGRSGWWMLFFVLVPVVGQIWGLVSLGFMEGAAGANRYGDDPLAGRRCVAGWLLLFCLGLTVFGPLAAVGLAASVYSILLHGSFTSGWRALVILDALVRMGLVAFGFCAGARLFGIHARAVETARWYLACILVYCVASAPVFFVLPVSFENRIVSAVVSAGGGVVYFLIWYFYLKLSKRVRATYRGGDCAGSGAV